MHEPCNIVIPLKNSPWCLRWCLEEIFRQSSEDERGTVLVVDDGSAFDYYPTIERICSRFDGVRLIRNEGNSGFGGAVNFGVAQLSQTAFFLLLSAQCLITRNTITKLIAACEADATIGMSSPLSNNCAALTLPLLRGHTYVEMNKLLEEACVGRPRQEVVFEACTVSGDCLMVRRRCWDAVDGFDAGFGAPDGEETDLQLRAMDVGYRGVATIDTYVFHHRSTTFGDETGGDTALRRQNLRMLRSRWTERQTEFLARCQLRDPAAAAHAYLTEVPSGTLKPDILFLLPGGSSDDVDGTQVVVDLCNHLVRSGLDAKLATFGAPSGGELDVLFGPILGGVLHFASEDELLSRVRPRAVVAALFEAYMPGFPLARAWNVPLINFVLRCDTYFADSSRHKEIELSYSLASQAIVTSAWVADHVRSILPNANVRTLPVGVNGLIHHPGGRILSSRIADKIRVAVLLQDRDGMGVLNNVVEGLAAYANDLSLTFFLSPGHGVHEFWARQPCTTAVQVPCDEDTIARHLRNCDVLLDTSLFGVSSGLMMLKAMACGAIVVAADSGAARDLIRDGDNGFRVREIDNPDSYVHAIALLTEDRELLCRLQTEAIRTDGEYDFDIRFDAYAAHFGEVLAHGVSSEPRRDGLAERRKRMTPNTQASRIFV